MTRSADLFKHPKSKQIVEDLLLSASTVNDARLKSILCAASEKIDSLTEERYRLACLATAMIKKFGGSVLIEKQYFESIRPSDEIETTDTMEWVGVSVR